jgi:hypothetical protein
LRKKELKQVRDLEMKCDGNSSSVSNYLPFIILVLLVFAACCWDKSVSDKGVSGGEEISLPSLLFLTSNNLFTVMMGILWLFEGME